MNLLKILLCFLLCINLGSCSECIIPVVLQGSWFSVEDGQNTITEFDASTMSRKGECIEMNVENHVNYTIVFKKGQRYTCVKILVRTVNVLEKFESSWVEAPSHMVSSEYICRNLSQDQQISTLFSENAIPKNCRSSLEGAWNFAYENERQFAGECDHPDARIISCQQRGSQLTKSNQKFTITYKKCPGINGTLDGVAEYYCLGDWVVGKNHYFAVANTRESRNDKKYRCFLKNLDDNVHIGVSVTAECNTLKTVATSPERLRITPVKSEDVKPGCSLPKNFSGDWIDSANAEVFINETHIIETLYSNEKMYTRTIYICHQQNRSQFIMARLTVDGCEKDYVCFDFVPQRHNVIHFSKSEAFTVDNFSTVCSREQQHNGLYLQKNPVAVRCPIAGRFNFTQKGDFLFETKPIVGITLAPRPNTRCRENISDFSVCDADQKEITLDEELCLRVDYLGRPVFSFSEPDYKMHCVAYWKNNNHSYLITFDDSDPFSQYRCWVYQKVEMNRILMSQAIGSFCDQKQNAYSYNYTEGAAVQVELQEYTDQKNPCPMHFDDGTL